MSRTVRRTVIACRAALAGAAAVVLLAACGGGGESQGDTVAADRAAEETGGGSGDADFCTQAAGIDERVDRALEDAGGEDPSATDAFRQIAEELRAIDAPEAIRSDWEAMAGGLDRMADTFADVDISDPGSLAALEEAESDLSAAGNNVEDYLRDECGIEP